MLNAQPRPTATRLPHPPPADPTQYMLQGIPSPSASPPHRLKSQLNSSVPQPHSAQPATSLRSLPGLLLQAPEPAPAATAPCAPRR